MSGRSSTRSLYTTGRRGRRSSRHSASRLSAPMREAVPGSGRVFGASKLEYSRKRPARGELLHPPPPEVTPASACGVIQLVDLTPAFGCHFDSSVDVFSDYSPPDTRKGQGFLPALHWRPACASGRPPSLTGTMESAFEDQKPYVLTELAHIDRVPPAKALRQSPPFTALLRHI
jgi:hypothetical protein